MFLDQYSTIFQHSSDNFTTDIQFSHDQKQFVTVSSSSISVWSFQVEDFSRIHYFELPETNLSDGDFLIQASWLDNDNFSVLSTNGNIFTFSITRGSKSQIKYTTIKSEDQKFTSIAGYHSNIIIGTESGDLIIMFPHHSNYQKAIIHRNQISDGIPIKSIKINSRNGLILAADGQTFLFNISPLALTSSNFDIHFRRTSFPLSSSIAISRNSDFAASFSPLGKVYVQDINNSSEKIIEFPIRFSSCSLTWADDIPDHDPTLFCMNDNTIGIWTPLTRSIRTFKIPEISRCNLISYSYSALFLVCSEGIYEFPTLLTIHGEFPVLIGRGTLIEFRPTAEGGISITHQIPTSLIGTDPQISTVAGDKDEKFFAVIVQNKILLLNRSIGKWFIPIVPSLSPKNLVWMGKYLCVISFDSSSLRYQLFFLKPSPPNVFILEHASELQGKPGPIAADDHSCAISFSSSGYIEVFNSSFHSVKLKIPQNSKIMQIVVNTRSKKVIALLSSRILISITIPNNTRRPTLSKKFATIQPNLNKKIINISQLEAEDGVELKTISEGVSNFFLDTNFNVLFVVRGLKIQIAGLAGKSGLSPFQETSSIPFGLFGSCSSIVLLPRGARPPFIPETFQFFDLSIVSEMSNPHRAAATIMPMRNLSSFRNIVRQIAVFSLREKLGKECVTFLDHFPEYRKEALVSALRAVETPERVGVFQAIGSCSSIFAEFAHLKMIHTFGGGNIMTFVQSKIPKKNDPEEVKQFEQDIQTASLLLPVIMEEEGPTVSFPATLFILSKMHEKEEIIESLVRFLDPLLSQPIKRDDGKVECVGMILEIDDYKELKRRLDLTVDECLLDLFRKFKPSLAVLLARSMQVPLNRFFQRHPSVDSEFSLSSVLEHLSVEITENDKKVYQSMYPIAKNYGWPIWSVALMLLVGDKTEAQNTISRYSRIKKQIQGTQWEKLLN